MFRGGERLCFLLQLLLVNHQDQTSPQLQRCFSQANVQRKTHFLARHQRISEKLVFVFMSWTMMLTTTASSCSSPFDFLTHTWLAKEAIRSLLSIITDRMVKATNDHDRRLACENKYEAISSYEDAFPAASLRLE